MNSKAIAEKLRQLRGKRTLQEVCDRIGITESALSQYETGKRIPKDDFKMKLAAFYGVSIEWLFFDQACHIS